MSLYIRVLPASHGDSILISFGDDDKKRNILIDGGIGRTYFQHLKNNIKNIEMKGERIDLLVITHIDEDHIEGICRMFEDSEFNRDIIGRVWFNSGEVLSEYFKSISNENREISLNDTLQKKKSVGQGISLEKELKSLDCINVEPIKKGDMDWIGEVKLRVLSPDISGLEKLNNKWEVEKNKNKKKARRIDYIYSIEELANNNDVEDTSIPNESSIAFLLEYRNMVCLMLGDSKASVVESAIRDMGYSEENKLSVNLLKLSHHGSKKNITKNFLDLIECSNFIISTNSEEYGLPDKECLAKIITRKKNVKFYFNYDYVNSKKIFLNEEYEKYKFECNILDDKSYFEIDGGIFLWK